MRWSEILAWLRAESVREPLPAVTPGNLRLLDDARDAEWVREKMTSFADSVGSFLPDHFEAYARLYHQTEPRERGEGPPVMWRDLAAREGVAFGDFEAMSVLRERRTDKLQSREGDLPPAQITALLSHLAPATTTADDCRFALWEGFGDCPVPDEIETTLRLPHRHYHLFAGPVEGALTTLSSVSWIERSANLWWSMDRSWFVSTEIDFWWTYVGGSRALISALVLDARLEAVSVDVDDVR